MNPAPLNNDRKIFLLSQEYNHSMGKYSTIDLYNLRELRMQYDSTFPRRHNYQNRVYET